MPTGKPPTLRQQRLGAELRKLRERAGLSSTDAARLHGVNQARMSMIEAGRYAVSADRVRTFARNYRCPDRELVDALAAMTGGRTRGWWDEYQELLPNALLDLAELEHHSTALRIGLIVHVPGLLQTADHVRAGLRETVPPLRPYEVEHLVSFRIKRQAVLYRDRMQYTAIVHEAALRMERGGPEVARRQLEYLIEASEQDNITIRVIPFGAAAFTPSGQSITYAYGPVPQLDTVELDTDHGCDFLDSETQLTNYRSVLDRMEGSSLPPEKSRDLIRQIAQDT
ncbi:helix-turn-helix domain-containing protein [Streptomyces silvisoli]|uniref:Helix-turn-helix transcriptional regulator n=1 Tax=Streptomyces silvisoli TaxID=3034235 RepID=A0ABT5ZSD9_9ACTN|nr:helix-turn-helix transcriptional regulator [Streptomyces silvisoli]MDF3292743.1 helix-turn-helix transcriptional regulator [Streptomyces silvisoli]